MNMLYFFEKYRLGDFDAIIPRFSKNATREPLSNELIIGIYNYVNFLVERQLDSGPFGNQTESPDG